MISYVTRNIDFVLSKNKEKLMKYTIEACPSINLVPIFAPSLFQPKFTSTDNPDPPSRIV